MNANRGTGVKVEKILVIPPDGGWGWVVVTSAFYCILIMDGVSNAFTLLIPIFQEEFHASVSEVSLINSLFTGFYFIFAPIAGSLSNRFGFRAIIIAGSLISSAGIAVSVFTSNVELMSATYGLVGGLGFSMMYINVVLTVGFYFEKWRALATGITVSASGVGTLSFAPVVQFLLQKYSWRHIFIGYAGLVFTCAFVAISFRPLRGVTLEEPEKVSLVEMPGGKITSMHNARYPTAADALDLNLQPVGESRRPKFWKCLRPLCRCSCKSHRRCAVKKPTGGVRPLYRDDIFFEGSLSQLPDYERNSTGVKSGIRTSSMAKISLLYHLSVSRLPTHKDVQEERDGKCHWCPESTTRALKTMFDFRVMKYPLFLLFTLSTCFLAAGVNVPIFFTYVRATAMGVMNESDGSLILTAMGVTNTIGRIICGLLGSVPRINMIMLHFGFLFFGAVLNAGIVFFHSKEVFFIYAALYGLVLAEQGSMRSVILVQLVGLENLTNAFGILLLFLGLFTIVGTPAAGYMRDLFGNYDAVFLFSSALFVLSAVSLIPLFLSKGKLKRGQKVEVPTTDPGTPVELAPKPVKSEEVKTGRVST